MSFTVSVVQPHVPSPIDFAAASSEEAEAWLERERTFTVYEAAIASDGEFYASYAGVAAELGLPLLARAYHEGLFLRTEDDLRQFLREIELVQGAWHARGLHAQWRDDLHGVYRWERLQEGAAALRHAARLALEGQLDVRLG